MPTRIALWFIAMSASAATPQPLIDYVTYLGGSYGDTAVGIAVDTTGSAYVAGSTASPNFPVTSTTLGAPSTNGCAFVTKFNPSGTAIDFSVCLANSAAIAFALDAASNMYLLISKLGNPYVGSYAVVKLDPTGQNILYNSAPIGGSPESMVLDEAGNVYVAGAAGPGLATTPGAYQQQYAGGQCPGANAIEMTPCTNAFITKLSASGSIAWTTYLGGSGPDDAHTIAVDSAGNVWVAGETVSPNFPTTPGAISRTFHGEIQDGPLLYGDAFVAKLDPTGAHLLYSTYLGGSAPDAAFGLAVDSSGAVYIAGGTQSTNFPTTPGAYQTTNTGYQPNQLPSFNGNGFVTKLDSSGGLVYSTFIGPATSAVAAITMDASGQAYVSVAGDATSSPIQPTCATPPNEDVLVLNASGSALVATSPIPGGYLVLDGKGGLYSAGNASTLVFFSTPHAFQTQYGGGYSDAFAAKVDFSQPAGPALSSVLNAASLLPGYATPFPTGAVAPGEIVTLFGNGFGSTTPSVNFSQFPAPVLYSSNCQINAVVPFEVTPTLPTFVTVQSSEQTLGPIQLPVVVSAPGIFTVNGSGSGQAAILNQDSTVNSASNPAVRGSIVSVFLTGVGALSPSIADGSPGALTPPFPAPVANISATIGGVDAPVIFAGQAPGLIAGATQVNIQVPQNAPAGAAVLITVYAANYASQISPLFTGELTEAVTMALR
jgi:uncharacterized protein (TIGR03437 family)